MSFTASLLPVTSNHRFLLFGLFPSHCLLFLGFVFYRYIIALIDALIVTSARLPYPHRIEFCNYCSLSSDILSDDIRMDLSFHVSYPFNDLYDFYLRFPCHLLLRCLMNRLDDSIGISKKGFHDYS